MFSTPVGNPVGRDGLKGGGGLGQFVDLRGWGALARKSGGGVVFEGGGGVDTPMHTMIND